MNIPEYDIKRSYANLHALKDGAVALGFLDDAAYWIKVLAEKRRREEVAS